MANIQDLFIYLLDIDKFHYPQCLEGVYTSVLNTMYAKYNESGYGKAKKVIDEMPAEQVKEYLKKMIEDNFVVGVEIIKKQK